MIESTQTKQNIILNNISLLKNSKNPFGVFFILADLKDIFISIGETLLNSIELNYSKESRLQYTIITQKYKEAGIFESLYNHYLHNNNLKKFKSEIDDYFQFSFFTDISFYLYTISRSKKYEILFDVILTFYKDEELKNEYYLYDTYVEKKEFLSKIHYNFSQINHDKDSFFIIKFLNQFQYFNFSQLTISCNSFIGDDIKLFKLILLYIFENKAEYHDLHDYMLETFVYDKNIYDETIEHFEEKKLFDIILFLKNDIHSGINYSCSLDYDTENNIKKYIHFASKIEFFSIEEKINFLLTKENNFLSLGGELGNFARLSFKRQFLEKNYDDIIDLILGITDIPIEVFYILKQQNKNLNLSNLNLYNEIKELILYIDKSYFLNFFKPFLLKNISNYFNNSDQKYYIVKFILCVILSNSHSEYKKISKFFYNLESFYKKTFSSFLSRIFQFGWIFIFIGIVGFFLPFGFFIAIVFFLFKEIIVFLLSKISPKLKMSLNFQFTTFLSFFLIFSLIGASTIGYKDNITLTYNSLKPIINSAILPAHESIKILIGEIKTLKASILQSNEYTTNSEVKFSDIDYLEGKNFIDIKK